MRVAILAGLIVGVSLASSRRTPCTPSGGIEGSGTEREWRDWTSTSMEG